MLRDCTSFGIHLAQGSALSIHSSPTQNVELLCDFHFGRSGAWTIDRGAWPLGPPGKCEHVEWGRASRGLDGHRVLSHSPNVKAGRPTQ
jgi:hypothetical protein